VEVASWFIDGTLIGVTGTNGKSTVTTLVGEMCKRSGRPTFVGGNLGTPLVDAVGTPAAAPGGYAVVELSSFQLERVERLHVHAAALLNVTEDHLDRYPSFAAYAAAKANIFLGQREDDAAVVRDGDEVCAALARNGRARVCRFGGVAGEARIDAGRLVDREGGLSVPVAEIPMTGSHNLDNACAAALLARLVGVAPEHVGAALRAFRGLPHRMAHVRDLDGVAYYDDSKATNVGATVAALDGLAQRSGRVVLIAGGRDKGGDYAPLVDRMARLGRAAILIGEAAGKIRAALESCDLALDAAGSMEDAVVRARAHARDGDVVLLAPACSSYDMFSSYAERGDAFQRAVRALDGGGA
jgi:UDP-N-acetylmuramoylalanine--D-glutamate ligase